VSRQRALVLVQQSARTVCAVCKTAGEMRALQVLGIPTAVRTYCLHCSPPEGWDAVEVWPLPMLDDKPRSA
jgi:hypothetical protein